MKYLVHQGVSVSARSLSSFLCRSSRARLCSVALSMSPSRRDSVTCCHSLLQTKLLTSVLQSFRSSPHQTARQDHCMQFIQQNCSLHSKPNQRQSVTVRRRWRGLWLSLTPPGGDKRLWGFNCTYLMPTCTPFRSCYGSVTQQAASCKDLPQQALPSCVVFPRHSPDRSGQKRSDENKCMYFT